MVFQDLSIPFSNSPYLSTHRPHLQPTRSPPNSLTSPPHPTARQLPTASPYSRRSRRHHHPHHILITTLRPRPILSHTLPIHHRPASLGISSLPRTWQKSSLCPTHLCPPSGFANLPSSTPRWLAALNGPALRCYGRFLLHRSTGL